MHKYKNGDVIYYRDGMMTYVGKIVYLRKTLGGDLQYDVECLRRLGKDKLPKIVRGVELVWKTLEDYIFLRSKRKIILQGEVG